MTRDIDQLLVQREGYEMMRALEDEMPKLLARAAERWRAADWDALVDLLYDLDQTRNRTAQRAWWLRNIYRTPRGPVCDTGGQAAADPRSPEPPPRLRYGDDESRA